MSIVKHNLTAHKNTMAVGFTGLKMRCSIGILPHEQIQLQELIVSLKVHLPHVPASMDVSSTIDYSALAEFCETLILCRHHGLLEILACELIDGLFDRFSCTYAWIRIEKPAAIPSADCGFVEYEKEL